MFPEVNVTTFSPDGRQLAVGPVEGAIEVFDPRSLVPIGSYVFEEMGSASDFAYSPDGHWLAAGGQDGTVRVWDVASGELRHSISGHTGDLWAVAWADDSVHLVTGSSDGAAIVWEVGDDGYRRELSFASAGSARRALGGRVRTGRHSHPARRSRACESLGVGARGRRRDLRIC